MRNLVLRASGFAAGTLAFVQKAFAGLTNPDSISGLQTAADSASIRAAIVSVIEKVLDFILLIAVIYVIFAGIRLIISGGDEGQKDKAKTTIIYVIIGIIVVLFARVIVTFVNSLFP